MLAKELDVYTKNYMRHDMVSGKGALKSTFCGSPVEVLFIASLKERHCGG